MAKIYPEEFANRVGMIQGNSVAKDFFVIPGKQIHPLPEWKKQELVKDPSFKDLKEQLAVGGPKDTWSQKHGYKTTFRQEAAILKANTREARSREHHPSNQQIHAIQSATVNDNCCVVM